MKIVVADDDPQMLGALRIILGAHGYDVKLARIGKDALDAVVKERPDLVVLDLVVLDLGMPQLNGIQVIEAIRGWSAVPVPILVVSGRTDSADKVSALDVGADDYVTKPFATDELLARIRALTRGVGGLEDTESVPELPEVQALVVDLGARLTGRTVARFEVLSFAALKTFDVTPASLAGQVIGGVARHGKFLDISVGDLHLVIHLARAGWIRWRDREPSPISRPGRGPLAARLVLGGGSGPEAVDSEGVGMQAGSGFDITEAGTKKSLALYLVRDPAEVPGIARLGPDPLDEAFGEAQLAGILRTAGRAQIKGVLRNQSVIAGIGNAYSDEILHTARMSPFKPAAMSAEEVSRLFESMQETLRGAISREDGLAASELKGEKKSGMQVHGRTGEPCPVCGDTVREVIFADSTLQYCPTCQTGGKPLADRVLSRLLK